MLSQSFFFLFKEPFEYVHPVNAARILWLVDDPINFGYHCKCVFRSECYICCKFPLKVCRYFRQIWTSRCGDILDHEFSRSNHVSSESSITPGKNFRRVRPRELSRPRRPRKDQRDDDWAGVTCIVCFNSYLCSQCLRKNTLSGFKTVWSVARSLGVDASW